jgi:hypothetical protein
VLSNPAYVVDLGTGALLWVSIGCGITSVLNPLLGFVAGLRYGGTAVVAASVVSLILGYLTVLIAYHVQNSVPFPDLLPKSGGAVVLACAVGTGLSLLATTRMGHVARESQAALTTTTVGACGILIAPMWLHPWRKRASEWLFSNFLPGGQRE